MTTRRIFISTLAASVAAGPTAFAEPIVLPEIVLDLVTAGKLLEYDKAISVVWKFYNDQRKLNKKIWGESWKLLKVTMGNKGRSSEIIIKGTKVNTGFNRDLVAFMQRNYDKNYRISNAS